MIDRPTRLFLRWRDRGDARALAAVFDRAAPELLRLALHLSGNVADAEDLLQGTFLCAIADAARFSRERRLLPWLVGILTHAAHTERRRRTRAAAADVEPDALPGAAADPGHAAAASEAAQALRSALDRLREPYRQPTMLRLCHGLQPAEIALLLERSPGTVRAQIHRGVEQLRRLVPAGVASSLALGAAPAGSGLAAVKTVVLAAGQRAVAAAGAAGAAPAGGLLGGLAMTKKMVLLSALSCGAAVALLGFAPPFLRDVAPVAGPTRAVTASSRADSSVALAADHAIAAPADRRAVAFDPGPGAWTLHARVVDGGTNAPIAGASIALHGRRAMTLLELQCEFGALGRPGPTGGLYSNLESLHGLPQSFDPEATIAGAPRMLLVPPREADRPLAATTSAADGSFDLRVAADGGMVIVSFAGYASRQLPFTAATADAATIALWQMRHLTGRVRTQTDEPPPPLDLLLVAVDWPSSGAWPARTDAAGAFEADVAAASVQVQCRTPGWTVTRRHGNRIERSTLDTKKGGTVYVARFGSTRLHVTDATDGAPLETIWLASSDENGYPRFCGRFHAPAGFFELSPFGADDAIESLFGKPQRAGTVVWADGHGAARIDDVPLYGAEAPVIEVQLERGGFEPLAGHLTRRGVPVAGARASLRPYSMCSWQSAADHLLAVARTDTRGAFALAAPAGEYLFEVVEDGRTELQRPLTLPQSAPLLVDLADEIRVTVDVVDAHGQPAANHNVRVRSAGGQDYTARTGADGRATLGPFAPGELVADAPLQATDDAWSPAVEAKVVAAAGEAASVRLQLPAPATVRARLAFDGPAPAGGFHGFVAGAHTVLVPDLDTAVEADGNVPLDLTPGLSVLRVATPDRARTWTFRVPAGARPGLTFVLRCAGLAYTGVLTDGSGKPVPRACVFATPTGGGPDCSATTDAAGAFRLDGLEACTYRLMFHVDPRARHAYGEENPLRMAFFATSMPPSPVPVELRVRLPRFVDGAHEGTERVVVTGRVLDAATGQPVAHALARIYTVLDQGGGELLLQESGWQFTTTDGHFRLVVARGDRLRAHVARTLGAELQDTTWVSGPGSACERDLVLR